MAAPHDHQCTLQSPLGGPFGPLNIIYHKHKVNRINLHPNVAADGPGLKATESPSFFLPLEQLNAAADIIMPPYS